MKPGAVPSLFVTSTVAQSRPEAEQMPRKRTNLSFTADGARQYAENELKCLLL